MQGPAAPIPLCVSVRGLSLPPMSPCLWLSVRQAQFSPPRACFAACVGNFYVLSAGFALSSFCGTCHHLQLTAMQYLVHDLIPDLKKLLISVPWKPACVIWDSQCADLDLIIASKCTPDPQHRMTSWTGRIAHKLIRRTGPSACLNLALQDATPRHNRPRQLCSPNTRAPSWTPTPMDNCCLHRSVLRPFMLCACGRRQISTISLVS